MKIDVRMQFPTPLPLPFAGRSPKGETLGVNSHYYLKNGKPWFPIMGELHYSRYNEAEWEREICKMKAGGVEIISSYIFWIHHEERKGEWDFSGCRNLRRFIEICEEQGLYVFLRIGPWPHGECRNGGFPDWLVHEEGLQLRSDDPTYVGYVRTLYEKIFEAARGHLFKEGGCIIGIQLENEYNHTYKSEPDAAKRVLHMQHLKDMALEIGYDLPYYSATAWGGACCIDDEMLPMLGCYVDAPWNRNTDELPESPNFLMVPALNDPNIGSDLNLTENRGFTCDITRYPYSTCELGGGIHSTKLRRILVHEKDTEAQTLCKLGGGCNLLGYYVYHGGTNPDGKLSTLQESRETGYPSDLTVKSYDFDAIIGEFGIPKASYGLTRRMHLFIKQWEEVLAPSHTVIPEDTCTDPADLDTLRYCVRHNYEQDCGFVFISHHLRKRTLSSHEGVEITVHTPGGTLTLPPIDVKDGDTYILPYNLPMGEGKLISTNAVPLCRLGARYFFYTDARPVYRFEGPAPEIITLSEADSRRACRFGDKLYLSDCTLYERNGRLYAETEGPCTITVWGESGEAHTISLQPPASRAACEVSQVAEGEYLLTPRYPDDGAELYITVDYSGDMAELFDGDRLLSDRFYNGRPYKVSLRQLGSPKTLTLRIAPAVAERYFDVPAPQGCRLNAVIPSLLYTLPL